MCGEVQPEDYSSTKCNAVKPQHVLVSIANAVSALMIEFQSQRCELLSYRKGEKKTTSDCTNELIIYFNNQIYTINEWPECKSG